jgi:hypothetical protein
MSKLIIPTLLSALLLPSSAEALSCMAGVYEATPRSGLTDLPINTLPLVWSALTHPNSDLRLLNVDTEEELDFSLTHLGSSLYTIDLDSDLEAGTTYQLIEYEWELSTFTIGDSIDEDGPETPIITDLDRERGSDIWGNWDYLVISTESSEDVAYFEVEVSDNANFDNPSIAWSDSVEQSLWIGSGVCGGNLPSREVRDIQFVRLTAYDYAGNPSEPSDIVEWKRSEKIDTTARGCSVLPGSTVGLWGLLSLLGLRRRR